MNIVAAFEDVAFVMRRKRQMLDRNILDCVTTCPRCHIRRAVRIQLAPSNKHALAYCKTEGCTFAEMRE